MSASSMPTFNPMPLKPSAKLTAVVDLPTPPLPDATAMMALTPSGAWAERGCAPARPRAGGAAAAAGPRPAARSAVSHHRRGHARHAAHRILRRLAHGFPALDD